MYSIFCFYCNFSISSIFSPVISATSSIGILRFKSSFAISIFSSSFIIVSNSSFPIAIRPFSHFSFPDNVIYTAPWYTLPDNAAKLHCCWDMRPDTESHHRV